MPRNPERPGRRPARRESQRVPDWAERERLGDMTWISENRHILWPAAQEQYRQHGPGALVVDLTTRAGPGHPFTYLPLAAFIELGDQDVQRQIRACDPTREVVIVLLKSQDRQSSYRILFL
jgi:hypothetical protein